jgi:hypothetical protein
MLETTFPPMASGRRATRAAACRERTVHESAWDACERAQQEAFSIRLQLLNGIGMTVFTTMGTQSTLCL